MRNWTAFLLILLATALFAGEAAAEGPLLKRLREAREQRREAQAGSTETRSLESGGRERSYQLLDAGGRKSAPLVILLHGGGGNGNTMIGRWSSVAQAQGLILAAPNGIGRNRRMGTWNASGCCGEAVREGVDDIGFVRAVIADVERTAKVDPGRVYVAGFSNGGMMTHRIAIALGDQIAAAAIVSGALFGNEDAPRAPTPVLIIHGEQDDSVPVAGGMSPTRAVARSQSIPTKPLRYAVDFWRKADGCGEPSRDTSGNVTIERSACRAGGEVVLYDLKSTGHKWPEAAADGIDAATTIWRFFEQHRRGG